MQLLLLGSVTQNWQICPKVQENWIPHQILFGFVCIGPKYWLGHLNFSGIITHIILLRRTWKCFTKLLLQLDCVKLRKWLKAISESLWQPKIHSIWLVHKVSAKGLGWSLMEIWELAKIPSVSWWIAHFSVLLIAEISR